MSAGVVYAAYMHAGFVKGTATVIGSFQVSASVWRLDMLDGSNRPATAAEITAATTYADGLTTADTKDATDAATARSHTKLKAIAAMSPAQVAAWVAANVTTLAQAISAIETLAVAVAVLARRL